MSGLQTKTTEELFPTKGAIEEARQIGRTAAMEQIAERIVAGDDIIVIQPRRIGKTSTIKNGALPRVDQQYGGVIAQIDLRQSGVKDDPQAFAEALQTTALATGADKKVGAQALARLAQKTKRFVHGDRAKATAELAGEAALAKTAQGLATVLVGPEDPVKTLRKTLAALEADAQRFGRPVVVFIDEAQDLGDAEIWPKHGRGVQEELARVMLQEERLMSFVFCGSDEHAMQNLFAKNQPLHNEGERYTLPPISDQDWIAELTTRFEEDGRTVQPNQLTALLDASGRHPGRTMRVCKAALRQVREAEAPTITDAMVQQAISEAQEHPAWT
jgi:hypothetical protein